jgi:hypothetical protein
MHVILGVLGLIVTILILINRLSDSGIDLGWLDPFKWRRRRNWAKRYHANPTYCVDDPMEATACLMYTIVKFSGDISMEEKAFLLSTFEKEFELTSTEAAQLLSTCSYLIKNENSIQANLKKFLKPSLPCFSEVQKNSACVLLKKTAYMKSDPNDIQQAFLDNILSELRPTISPRKW